MRNDDLRYCLRVKKPHKEDEWNEMVVQDHGLKVQVDWDKSPGGEER